MDGQRNLKKRYGFIMPIYGSEEEAQKDTFLSFPEGSIGRYQSYKFQVMKPNLLTPGEWRRDLLHEKIVEAEQRYVFVENKHKVAVGDRLKKYNLLTTLVWDYMEQSDYSYHGVIRSWS
ncbi:hypothetical protein AMS62_12375 [Bacillus sp. FJAT-18019]|nr:hypothetical protein AMS62_12375 [Bacillus sp. FJAT-18019]